MKKNYLQTTFILLFFLAFFSPDLNAQWIKDSQYGFKINVPASWSKKSYKDGTDKVWDFYSPDQNAAIQLRAFNADTRITLDLLVQVYEQNMLPAGAKKQSLNDHTSAQGIPGKMGVYKMNYNGNAVNLAAFYTIQNQKAYVLTAIIPISMLQQKGEEVKSITHSFQLDGFRGLQANRPVYQPKAQSRNFKFQALVLDGAGVEFNMPTSFKRVQKESGQSIWADNKRDVKMVIQTMSRDQGKTIYSQSRKVKSQVKSAGGQVLKDVERRLGGMPAVVLSYQVMVSGESLIFNSIFVEAPGNVLALGFVSALKFQPKNKAFFQEALNSLKKANPVTAQTSSAVLGKYNLYSRSDGKDLLVYWFIQLNADGTYLDQHQLKSKGNYVSKEEGRWTLNGNQLILSNKYHPNLKRVYHVSGRELVSTSGSVVFVFRK